MLRAKYRLINVLKTIYDSRDKNIEFKILDMKEIFNPTY